MLIFGITQYLYENPHTVTKLVPQSLRFTKLTPASNITGPSTPLSIPILRSVILNLESLQFFSCLVFNCLISKEQGFVEIQLKLMIKISKNVMKWVWLSQIPPICLNLHVPTHVVKTDGLRPFQIFLLIFNHPSIPLQVWQPLIPNQEFQEIICLNTKKTPVKCLM